MDRFLLAENPMNEGGGIAVIHTIDPVAIVECIEEHFDYPADTYYKHFSFTNIDGDKENWTLRLHHLFSTELDSEQHHKIVNHLLDRAWRWYQSYMNWEDKHEI
jgi:hypothetical protein